MNKLICKKGFTLTEVLLVMAVAAMIIISVFFVYDKVNSASKADIESKNISMIISNIRSLYASSNTYTGMTVATLKRANVFPDNMILDDSNPNSYPKNQWKGNVMINVFSGGSTMSLVYFNVPSYECVKIITNTSSMLYSVTISGTTLKEEGGDLDIELMTKTCSLSKSNVITMAAK